MFSLVAVVVAVALSSDTTACSLFGPRCAYRLVFVKLLCPSKSTISSSGAPFIRRRLANVCRKSCQRKFLIYASVTALSKPAPPIFERLLRFRRLEHTPSAFAPVMHNPQGG